MHDTKTPVVVGVIAMTGNILLSFAFSRLFSQIGWLPLGGLALANTVATAVESLALMAIMRRRLSGVGGKQILRTGALALAASTVMGLAVFAWMSWSGSLNKFLVLAVGVVVGVVVYAAMLWLLKVPEAGAIVRQIKGRLAHKG